MSERFTLHHGDCIEVMRSMPDNSVDSIVTDPPYGLEFMGKEWDKLTRNLMRSDSEADKQRLEEYGDEYQGRRSRLPDLAGAAKYGNEMQAWHLEWAREALRVLKPGGHLLAFSGSRTYHRMAVAIEDAGFEIRDQIMWIYGSGFPKSLDVSKAIDKTAGAEREVVLVKPQTGAKFKAVAEDIDNGGFNDPNRTEFAITAPATPQAQQWQGWGTALKPAHEPIVVARKPLSGTVAANVLAHGVGALNIDGCRVGSEERFNTYAGNKDTGFTASDERSDAAKGLFAGNNEGGSTVQGRWPANVIHDGSDEVVALFPDTGKSTGGQKSLGAFRNGDIYGSGQDIREAGDPGYGDSGSAARFFYCAKANKRDRNEGLDPNNFPLKHYTDANKMGGAADTMLTGSGNPRDSRKHNHHPTVKPTELMRYLIRLVTPQGATILDPFMGSGSTGKAAMFEGVNFIGIEQDAEYLAIAKARIEYALNKPAEEVLFPREEATTEQLVTDDQLPLFTQDTA